MNLTETIQKDLITALKAKDQVAMNALRGLKSALQQEMIEQKGTLDEQRAFAIVKREIKKRQDSLDTYRTAKRDDLANQEQAEIDVLIKYQPQRLTETELREKITQIMAQSDNKDFGPLMGKVMSELGESADGKQVQVILKELLTV